MAQKLRVLDVLPEELGSLPIIYMALLYLKSQGI